MDVYTMKVADLKLELKQRGLPTTGNKTELAERLQLVMQDSSLSLDETTDEIDEDAVLADEEIEEEAEAIGDKVDGDGDGDGDIEDDVEVEEEVEKEAEALLSSTEESSSTAKKVILKRNPVIEEVKVDVADKDDSDKLSNTGPEKKIIKLSELDAKERLEMRAKKFGVPITDSTKKEARSARFNANNNTNNGNSKSAASIKTPVHTTYDTLKKRAERFGTNVSTLLEKAEQEDRILKRKARFGEVKPMEKVIPTKIKIVK